MNRDLSLVEAFRGLGPLTGDPAADEVRTAAATLLLQMLRQLSRRLWGNRADGEEAVDQTLLRLLPRGPRGIREGDPTTDAGVKRYLFTALRNNVADIADVPELLVEDMERVGPVSDDADGIDGIDIAWAHQELAAARTELKEIVQRMAQQRRRAAGEAFLNTVQQLEAIAAGLTVVNQIVREECGPTPPAPSSSEWKRARNRVDKRFSRALQDIFKELAGLRDRGAFPAERVDALQQVVKLLCPRQE